ncbi:MAG TPA: hypothetical protein VJA47_05990 [archaeon]|nr:hypothetical protein [archaeon]
MGVIKILPVFIVLAVLVVSGCATQPSKPITTIKQGFAEYKFLNDLRGILKIEPETVGLDGRFDLIFTNKNNITLIFDGSSSIDNAYFRVVVLNFMTGLTTYLTSNNMQLPPVSTFYYIGDENTKWYTSENNSVPRPLLSSPVVWLKGPHTGATENKVQLLDNKIAYLMGTNSANLTMMSERLLLSVMGINSIEDISKKGFEVVG